MYIAIEKNKIRLVSLLLAIIIFVISVFAVDLTANAEGAESVLDSGKCGDTLFWELTADGVLRIFGEGAMYNYNKYYEPSPWYKYRDEPYISEDGTKILNCDGTTYLPMSDYTKDNPEGYKIKDIVIEEGVTYIGDWAFYRVCVEELTVPEGVEETGVFCFRFSPNLKVLTLPDSLKVLDDFAISRNYLLETINLGNGIEKVGTAGFNNNPSLKSLVLPESCTQINTQLSPEPDFTDIDYNSCGLMENCSSLKTVGFGSVDKIPQRTCLGADIETVIIPNTVKSIDSYAFYTCDSLKTVIFEEDSVCENIANNAFQGCTSLESVTGGTALKTIGVYTLMDKLTEFDFSSTNTKLEKNQFYKTALKTAYVSENITTIPTSCFNGMPYLEKIYLPNSLKSIEGSSFNHTVSLKDIYYNGNLEEYNAISKVSGWSYGINKDCVVHLSDGTFATVQGTLLSNDKVSFTVKFEDYDGKVISVQNVKYMDSAEAPDAPLREGYNFVGWDRSFSEITDSITVKAVYEKTPVPVKVLDSGKCGDDLYWELKSDGELRIFGEGAMYDYSSSSQYAPWYKYRVEPFISNDGNDILNPDGKVFQTSEKYYASNPKGYKVESIVIESGITHIGDWAFYRVCVDSIDIPEGVKSAGSFAFSYSPQLVTLDFPDTLETLDDFSVCRNYSLKNLELGNGLKEIGAGGLSDNVKLESLVMPEGCTSLNTRLSPAISGISYDTVGLLANCSSLKSVTFGKISKIPQRALLRTAVEEIVVPNTVERIEEYAFFNCNSLKKVMFEENSKCVEIDNSAFIGCTNLESVKGGTALQKLGSYATLESLTEFDFSTSNKELSPNQFNSTSLKEVIISNNISVIPVSCFNKMTKLETLYLPCSITEIQASSFNFCSSLKDIYYDGTYSEWFEIEKAEGWYYKVYPDCVIHFKDGKSMLLSGTEATPDSPDIEEYTVTFVDFDGTVISTQKVLEGASADEPELPSREGYIFIGWDGSFDKVYCDVTVNAVYSPDPDYKFEYSVFVEVTGGSGLIVSVGDSPQRPYGNVYIHNQIFGGTVITVRALCSDEKEFLGWIDANGTVVCESEEYTFTVDSDTYLKALYSADTDSLSLVVFKTESVTGTDGTVVDWQYYSDDDEIVVPSLPDESYVCWDKSVDDILNLLSASKIVTVYAVKNNM